MRKIITVIIGIFLLGGGALWLYSPTPFTVKHFAHNVTQFSLENGMQVVLIPSHKVPAVSHMMWYHVGAVDEPEGKSGIAHFLEHLMFKGTENIDPGVFSNIIAKMGGDDNAFTGQDYTAYYQNIPKNELATVMEMEADRMRGLLLTPETVMTERDVILEERRSRTDNVPRNVLVEKMRRLLFPHHPYGIPIIGWPEEISALTQKDALDFYRTYYAPNNATLVVAGDITYEELKPLAERYYGTIPPSTLPKTKDLKSVRPITQHEVYHIDKRVTQPELFIFYRAPSQNWGRKQDAPALEILAQLLGGGSTSHLYNTLVLEHKLAVSISASYSDVSRGPGVFTISAMPRKDVPLEVLEHAIKTEVTTFLGRAMQQDEITRAKTILVADAMYARDSFKTLAFLYGQIIASNLSISYIDNWPDTIQKTTDKDIIEAAFYTLREEERVTGYLHGKGE